MPTLPQAAQPAWEAYLAMDRSKRAHFGYLAELEQKYEQGGSRTITEAMRLKTLLSTHDENVKRFKHAVTTLAVENLAAHHALLEQITQWNTQAGQDDGRKQT